MRSQPHRDPSPRADTNEVDALERRPPPAVEQRSPREAVFHDDEAPRRKLAFQHFPDLQIGGRAAQARNRDGGEQLAIIRHAATSFATRSRSEAATGASGGRTGPPYSPPPTASMAAFTPAGPSFPTISRSSGEALLELPRAFAVAGAERGEHLRAERRGETRHGKDAPVAPQLQGGVQQ